MTYRVSMEALEMLQRECGPLLWLEQDPSKPAGTRADKAFVDVAFDQDVQQMVRLDRIEALISVPGEVSVDVVLLSGHVLRAEGALVGEILGKMKDAHRAVTGDGA